jgi:hypothetical protein
VRTYVINGVRTVVPNAYDTYPERHRAAVAGTVADLKTRFGDRLVVVHITRVVKTRLCLQVVLSWTVKDPDEEYR